MSQSKFGLSVKTRQQGYDKRKLFSILESEIQTLHHEDFELTLTETEQKDKYGHRYVDHAIQSKCFPDLLMMGMFPNTKEVTESWGMFEATKHLDGFEWNNPHVTCFVVGDGRKPRTGATLAMRTSWNIVSIDPDLVNTTFPVDRLSLFRRKVEEFTTEFHSSPILVMLPHSHAKIADCLERIKGTKRAVITMDCCINNQIVENKPDVEYVDYNVWSPMNTVRVWRDI